MVLLDTPQQLPLPVGSSRAYLQETQVLPSVECGIEDMLRACTAAAEAGERVDPINFLATYLMRNNPRHSEAAVERLASHQRAKELAAAIASYDVSAAQGALYGSERTLSQLIGRPTTTLATSVERALKSL